MHYTKLQEPPRVRPRVHELAKQVGLTSAELIELLTAMGVDVRTAQELVELPVVRKVHGVRGIVYELPLATDAPPQSHPTGADPRALSSAPATPKRNNHPLKSASERSRDQDLRRERGNRRHEDGCSATRAGDACAAGSRAEASFAFEFEEWKSEASAIARGMFGWLPACAPVKPRRPPHYARRACQRPVRGPLWWPTESPHSSWLISWS